MKAMMIGLLSAGLLCCSTRSIAAEYLCELPTMCAHLRQAPGGYSIVFVLQNTSRSVMSFEQWSMDESMIDLVAETASGTSLQRFVPLRSPGMQPIQLPSGRSRVWTYALNYSFPDLEKSLAKELVKLSWEVELIPLGGSCSIKAVGSFDLPRENGEPGPEN